MADEVTGKTSGDVVTVACKLPAGLVVRDGEHTITLNGSNNEGSVAGFGITQGVDKSWWEKWSKGDGAKHPAISNGSIFANTAAKAVSEAKEKRKEIAGFEPIDPTKPGPGIKPIDAPQE